ncbi:MAG TPA: MBL fold metallo-hydrolase [Leucothrix sp.]|nr:MBL fold metallo-hydrolase [Leucothrix sp.]
MSAVLSQKLSLKIILICLLGFIATDVFSAQLAGQAMPSACQSQRVKLQMLGTRGPEILDGQASTSYLIWLDNKARVIVDTGAGSLQRFEQSKANFEDVELMLFSHFHVDHSSDFPAYIKGAFFTDRKKDLYVLGPTGTEFVASAEQFVERAIDSKAGMYPYLGSVLLKNSISAYKIKTQNIEWSYRDLNIKTIYNRNGITVKTVSTHHGPFPSQGYRVELAGCSIAFSGDMSGRLRAMPDLAKNVDILVAHNAIPEDATGVPALLHMTPSYIGKMAKKANVKLLLLTHLMKRSLSVKKQTLQLIRKNYNGKVLYPNDLDSFNP